MGLARALIRVGVVFRAQQILDLVRVGVELQPLLVGRLRDAVASDAHALQPLADTVDALLRRREQVVDLLRGEVLTIPGGLGVRATSTLSALMFFYLLSDIKDLHIHEEIMAPV